MDIEGYVEEQAKAAMQNAMQQIAAYIQNEVFVDAGKAISDPVVHIDGLSATISFDHVSESLKTQIMETYLDNAKKRALG